MSRFELNHEVNYILPPYNFLIFIYNKFEEKYIKDMF